MLFRSVLESPNCSLRRFKRITLEPGASQEVEFVLCEEDLMMVDNEGEKILESGEYTITVGGGQPDHRTEELTGQKVLRFSFRMP